MTCTFKPVSTVDLHESVEVAILSRFFVHFLYEFTSSDQCKSKVNQCQSMVSKDQQRPAKSAKVNQCQSAIRCLLGYASTLSKDHAPSCPLQQNVTGPFTR